MKLTNNLSFGNLIKYYESMYKCSYDDFQVDELRIGYERGIDISKYADPRVPLRDMIQMYQKLCKQKGVPVK